MPVLTREEIEFMKQNPEAFEDMENTGLTNEDYKMILANPDKFSKEDVAEAKKEVYYPESWQGKVWEKAEPELEKAMKILGKGYEYLDKKGLYALTNLIPQVLADFATSYGAKDTEGKPLFREGDYFSRAGVSEYTRRLGMNDRNRLSELIPSLYSKTGAGPKLQRGGPFDFTPKSATDLAGTIATDLPGHLIGKAVGTAAKLTGRGLKVVDKARRNMGKKIFTRLTGTSDEGLRAFIKNPARVEAFGKGKLAERVYRRASKGFLKSIDDAIENIEKIPVNGRTVRNIEKLDELKLLKKEISTKVPRDFKEVVKGKKTIPKTVLKESVEIPDSVLPKAAFEKAKQLRGVSVTKGKKGVVEALSQEAASAIDDILDAVPGSETKATRAAFNRVKELKRDFLSLNDRAFTSKKGLSEVTNMATTPQTKKVVKEFIKELNQNPAKNYDLVKKFKKDFLEQLNIQAKQSLDDYLDSVNSLSKVDISPVKKILKRKIDEIKTLRDVDGPTTFSINDQKILDDLEKQYARTFTTPEQVVPKQDVAVFSPQVSQKSVSTPSSSKVKNMFQSAGENEGILARANLDKLKRLGTKVNIDEVSDLTAAAKDFFRPDIVTPKMGVRAALSGGLANIFGVPWGVGLTAAAGATSPWVFKQALLGNKVIRPIERIASETVKGTSQLLNPALYPLGRGQTVLNDNIYRDLQ